MMKMQEGKNLSINDIDLSLLRLSSPPYNHSFFSSPVSPPHHISPFKRSSPLSDESYDHNKRRRISSQDPIFIDDPTRYQDLTASRASPVTEKQETSKTLDTETMKMVNDQVDEINQEETTNYDAYEEEEEDCGKGMRIERSGDGFVIRLKCRCKLAYRVLFSDHHLYFKSL